MAGVTDHPFRTLVRRYGVGLAFTEMVAGTCLLHDHGRTRKMVVDAAAPAVQLAGADPAIMAEAARRVVDLGAVLVDINMGCPVKKVVKGQGGAALMRDPDRAERLVAAVSAAVSVPVTVKMRLGWEAADGAPALARRLVAAGARWITVHGRTRTQGYGGQVDRAGIRAVVESVPVPVIANGDITHPAEAASMLADTGAHAVMIGRGAMGRPWFPNQVQQYLATGHHDPDPDLTARHALLQEHLALMVDHHGPRRGVLMARKHLGWGLAGLPGAAGLRAEINQAPDAATTAAVLARGFATLAAEAA